MDKDIRCESYLWVQGIQTSTEDLTPTQREALAIWLKKEYLNELCRGRKEFPHRVFHVLDQSIMIKLSFPLTGRRHFIECLRRSSFPGRPGFPMHWYLVLLWA